jgi:hypothetical protein
MIETVLYNYLNTARLSASVYMEQPASKPAVFFLLEKTGGSQENHINESTFIIQSFGRSLVEAATMNEEIKAVMQEAVTLPEISRVEINSDYNFTDHATKTYRYQVVFVVTHY